VHAVYRWQQAGDWLIGEGVGDGWHLSYELFLIKI
jgi:hypothetical protein